MEKCSNLTVAYLKVAYFSTGNGLKWTLFKDDFHPLRWCPFHGGFIGTGAGKRRNPCTLVCLYVEYQDAHKKIYILNSNRQSAFRTLETTCDNDNADPSLKLLQVVNKLGATYYIDTPLDRYHAANKTSSCCLLGVPQRWLGKTAGRWWHTPGRWAPGCFT